MLRKRKGMGLLAFMAVLIMTVCSGNTFAQGEAKPSVQIKNKKGIGNYLADSKGMTLYYFKDDYAGYSACEGDCLKNWPPFHAKDLIVPPGLAPADIGVMTRDDGKEQITFRGYPLYYFHKDKKPGDTLGQNVREMWFVVDPEALKPAETHND